MKKKTIYRVAAIPMLAVLTLALAGCGTSRQEAGQVSDTEPSAQEYTTEPESTEPASLSSIHDLLPEIDLEHVIDIMEVTTTEPPTEPPTELPTEPPTEPETELETEPETPAEVELAITLPVNFGDVSDSVHALQVRLIELGYLEEGTDDGSFGPMTRDALSLFQENNSLPVTGVLDEETLTVLRSIHAQTAYGYTVPQIRAMNVEAETEPGHEHEFTASIVEPDCILGGYTRHVCSCGTVRVDSLKKSWVTTFA